jgi:hypothetical protein
LTYEAYHSMALPVKMQYRACCVRFIWHDNDKRIGLGIFAVLQALENK